MNGYMFVKIWYTKTYGKVNLNAEFDKDINLSSVMSYGF